MSDEKIRYALGGSGQLYKFTGKDLPAGADPLIEEDGTTLTATGNQYCKTRGIGFPNAEVLRVLCDQYSSATLPMAAKAHDLNLDLMPQRQDKTKLRIRANLRGDRISIMVITPKPSFLHL